MALAGITVVAGTIFYFVRVQQVQAEYGDTNSTVGLSLAIDIAGIVIGVWLSQKARTTEMKDFEKVYAQAINDINSISITRNDFNLNLIDTQNSNNNNNALGN